MDDLPTQGNPTMETTKGTPVEVATKNAKESMLRVVTLYTQIPRTRLSTVLAILAGCEASAQHNGCVSFDYCHSLHRGEDPRGFAPWTWAFGYSRNTSYESHYIAMTFLV